MTIKTVKVSSDNQVYLPKDILDEAGLPEDAGTSFVVRVRDHVIKLVPVDLAEEVLDAGLANLRRASLERLTEAWDNPDDEAWDEV